MQRKALRCNKMHYVTFRGVLLWDTVISSLKSVYVKAKHTC